MEGWYWCDGHGAMWPHKWHKCRGGSPACWKPPGEWWHADHDPMEILRNALEHARVDEAPLQAEAGERGRPAKRVRPKAAPPPLPTLVEEPANEAASGL